MSIISVTATTAIRMKTQGCLPNSAYTPSPPLRLSAGLSLPQWNHRRLNDDICFHKTVLVCHSISSDRLVLSCPCTGDRTSESKSWPFAKRNAVSDDNCYFKPICQFTCTFSDRLILCAWWDRLEMKNSPVTKLSPTFATQSKTAASANSAFFFSLFFFDVV